MQEGIAMQSEQVQTMFSPDATSLVSEGDVYRGVLSEKPLTQPFTGLVRNFQSLIRSVKNSGAFQHAPDETLRAEEGTTIAEDEGLKTQINERDREHLQEFPAHRKAMVMEKIMSLTPARHMVFHGKNHFEKAVLKIRRDGFRLIDLQPQETAFTTVWYRKGRSFLGKGADVTMLLWEHSDEHGDSTTMMSWRI
jgi:hypothetical protein